MNTRFLLPALALCASTLAAPATAAPFRGTGYTMNPPAGLQKSNALAGTVDVFFLNRDGASLNVIRRQLPAGTTLDQLKPALGPAAAQGRVKNFKILRRGTMTVGGERALTMESTFLAIGKPIPTRGLSVMTLRRGTLYVFTCGAPTANYARYAPAFKKSLASLKWTR